ncbi:hypothetical protein ZTR_09724 [Talaromyces verruculosus]|nr:hypothetical protein ZTR_09724 [Talaromyces verruculosus]
MEEYGCGSKCQEILSITNKADLVTTGMAFDFDFYDTAANFSSSAPGDLLKIAPVDPATLDVPAGISVWKMQYTSQEIDGSLVPVSGFIALPFNVPEGSKKIPVVAFAHGTIGVYRGCAPSSSPSLFDYLTWSPIIERGYAVVATDYAGLGNNFTTHKYSSLAAQANDVVYSIKAAGMAFGSILTHEWVSVGHSQGGGAVWKLSEHPMVQAHHSGYLGGVAISPSSKIYDMVLHSYNTILQQPDFHHWVITAELPSLGVAIKNAFPQSPLAFLGEGIKRRLDLAETTQSCTTAMLGLTLDLTLNELLNGSALLNDPFLQEWQRINAPASGASATRPLMIVHGLNDTSVLPESTIHNANLSCGFGNEIHLRLYPGLDHSATPISSAPEWLRWIDDRFVGKPSLGHHLRKSNYSRCTTVTHKPVDIANTKAPLEFDFASLGV